MNRMKFAQGAAGLFLAQVPHARPDIRGHAEAIARATTADAMMDVMGTLKDIAADTTEAYALFELCCLARASEAQLRLEMPEIWVAQIIDYFASVGVPRSELEALVESV